MTIIDFIKNNKLKLNNSLIVGYYGGCNFGDELLLETLLLMFSEAGIEKIRIAHLQNHLFESCHNFNEGYSLVSYNKIINFLKALLSSNNIIVGGGGLWGKDVNGKILILSIILFLSKVLFKKKVYILGVGYYNSTTMLGKIAAWIAGRFADLVIVRDYESYINFSKVTRNCYQDKDISFNLNKFNLNRYQKDLQQLEKKIVLRKRNVIITNSNTTQLKNSLYETVKTNSDINFIFLQFLNWQLPKKHGDYVDIFKKLAITQDNIRVYDFDYNPIALYLFLKKNKDNIFIISQQFHGQVVAHLTGSNFLPISYDNKNEELFKIIKIQNFYHVNSITKIDIQKALNSYFGDY